ncbi:(2Fe-2S)-binding protein [Marinibactrum halimedae]|uniref:(2Fe-2S)-binding protein n=1 Tax=Marinibactrum halimedae TaxID=1444977 RepID=A0AA37T949_9GAMM|nr:(2Fe-2S)-binding protein [Marinibactrum halimedae]MCD9459694.1 (2Fe-2S)-binding protein [Marinibactrum halimedae]GLS25720.1 (2Fe-2S)-binding protein [Marinibactrum halimedae]
MISIIVNNKKYEVDVEPEKPLLWVLREELELLGTKFGCGFGICGACTVHIDGEPQQCCVITIGEVVGRRITTIEGLNDRVGQCLKNQWVENSVPQCGYCQPGFIMSAAALIYRGFVNEESIRELPNICRCGTYQRVKKAIYTTADQVGVWEGSHE